MVEHKCALREMEEQARAALEEVEQAGVGPGVLSPESGGLRQKREPLFSPTRVPLNKHSPNKSGGFRSGWKDYAKQGAFVDLRMPSPV